MCGIAGYITKRPSKKAVRAFKALLVANEDRGEQSTGVFYKDTIYKDILPASEFVYNLNDNDMWQSKITLGHTRFATQGKVKAPNAHPFRFGDIVGVHNGIVNNYFNVYPQARVDSEAIFYLLNKKHNNYRKAFKRLEGSFGLAWTEGKSNLYLARHGNPLSVAHINDTIFFSSEFYHLQSVLFAVYGKVDYIEEIEENNVYKFDSNLKGSDHIIKFKTFGSSTSHSTNNSYYDGGYDYDPDDYDYMGTAIDKPDDNKVHNWLQAGQVAKTNRATFENLMIYQGCFTCGKKVDVGYLDVKVYQAYCENCAENLGDDVYFENLERIW